MDRDGRVVQVFRHDPQRKTSLSNDDVRALLEDRFNVSREDLQAVALPALRHRLILGFEAQADGVTPERFEVVVNLLSLSKRQRVRIRVQVPESDPSVDSLVDVYPGTDAMEREAYDLIGILFHGHPDMTRILMPEDWEGHPLRKDYGVGRVPVQFKEAPGPR